MKSQSAQSSAAVGQEASLRRLDWRFLLPSAAKGRFRHLMLWGGPAGLDERMIKAKLAEQVSCQGAPGSRADAVINLHGSGVQMEKAVACLEEGGVLYQEIARHPLSRLPRSAVSWRRHCRQMGLTLTGLYWAAPNFEECRRYIPLDVAGAIPWYFSSLFVAGTPTHRTLRAILRLPIASQISLAAWLAPTLSITAVAGDSGPRPPALLEEPQLATLLPNEDLRPIILTSGQDDGSRAILLPFSRQGRPSPHAVIKIATDPNFNSETENESIVLCEVRKRLKLQMRRSIPEAKQPIHYQGLAVSVESCAPGQSLWASSGAWGVSQQRQIHDMELSVEWLIDFHKQTQTERLVWDQQSAAEWIEKPLADYAQVRVVTTAEERLFALMRDYGAGLTGAELPLVWQHHDFAPWNLFREDEQLTVIDWEFNREWGRTQAGPALCDLLYFVTYWNNVVQKLYTEASELEGMRRLFLGSGDENGYLQAARRSIAQYVRALRMDGRFVPLLLAYTWIERVVYSYRRTQKLEGRAKTSRAAAKFAGYVDFLAVHAETLFSPESARFWQMDSAEAIRPLVDVPAAMASA